MKSRISVIILCYRKFDFLYEAIDSVINQDYENIELVVSDDCSPDFPDKKVRDHICKNSKNNITSIIINHEKENCGTVKHINHAIKLCTGEYIALLAGDDAFYNEKVLSRYVSGFEKCSKEYKIEMAQTAMCDYQLDKIQGYYLQHKIQKVLVKEDYDTEELFTLIAYRAYLPSTSTCFRRAFFDDFAFDERYKLVEDVPMHLRITREGKKIHFENFVAVKHRTGGISHGNIGGLSKSQIMYLNDLINIGQYEVMPYINMVSNKRRSAVKESIKVQRIINTYQLIGGNRRELIIQFVKHPIKTWVIIYPKSLNIILRSCTSLILFFTIMMFLVNEDCLMKRVLDNTMIVVLCIYLIFEAFHWLNKVNQFNNKWIY